MKRFVFFIGVLIVIQTGCNDTNSNVVTNNNSVATTAKSPAASSPDTSTPLPQAWSYQKTDATAVVEKFIAAAERGDVAGMEKEYSQAYVKQKGAELNPLAKRYSDLIRGFDPKDKPGIFDMAYKTRGDKVHVAFNYGITKNGAPAGKMTGCTAFDLVKEGSEWKIDGSSSCD